MCVYIYVLYVCIYVCNLYAYTYDYTYMCIDCRDLGVLSTDETKVYDCAQTKFFMPGWIGMKKDA